jgi:hypothetical protein
LRLEGGVAWLDGQPLETPLLIDGTADAAA